MENLYPEIRNAARALIIKDSSVLLLRKVGGSRGERFALPGGAQDVGEILEDALQRECLEEIGVEVQIEALVHVADFFKRRDTDPPSHKHLVEFIFRCQVPDDYIARQRPQTGQKPGGGGVDAADLTRQHLALSKFNGFNSADRSTHRHKSRFISD